MSRNSGVSRAGIVFVVTAIVVASRAVAVDVQPTATGCANLCCSGKNNTCSSVGSRINGKGSPEGKCYCDEGCTRMGDCCLDYLDSCQAKDCKVSEWFDYGECNKECGLGQQMRVRSVVQEPKNGGKSCPVLQEVNVCVGTKCKLTRHVSAGRTSRETASIMPASFGKFRTMTEYDFSKDIRKNLFNQYYQQQVITRGGYCSKFRITSTKKGCTNNAAAPWSNVLQEGAVVCVECQKTAMEKNLGERCKGHGQMGVDTNWKAVNVVGCHGWWRMVEEHSDCQCGGDTSMDFIFV